MCSRVIRVSSLRAQLAQHRLVGVPERTRSCLRVHCSTQSTLYTASTQGFLCYEHDHNPTAHVESSWLKHMHAFATGELARQASLQTADPCMHATRLPGSRTPDESARVQNRASTLSGKRLARSQWQLQSSKRANAHALQLIGRGVAPQRPRSSTHTPLLSSQSASQASQGHEVSHMALQVFSSKSSSGGQCPQVCCSHPAAPQSTVRPHTSDPVSRRT